MARNKRTDLFCLLYVTVSYRDFGPLLIVIFQVYVRSAWESGRASCEADKNVMAVSVTSDPRRFQLQSAHC